MRYMFHMAGTNARSTRRLEEDERGNVALRAFPAEPEAGTFFYLGSL
jgi:hypothetical protein